MRTIPLLLSILGLLLFIPAFAGPAGAVSFTTLDYPGAISTQVYGINNAGLMVGVFVDSANVTHGFLLNNGNFTVIDFPGASLTVASGINNKGHIVGQYNDSTGFGHGFLLENRRFTTVDFPPYQTFPTAIGDADEIVGFCTDAQFNFHGCISVNGVFSLLDEPGASATVALGISFPQATIVGSYGTINGYTFQRGFAYLSGHFSDIIFPGAQSTSAFGINNKNVVIGNYSRPNSSVTHGFLLYARAFHTTDFPGAASTDPINLNDNTTVVGWYVDKTGGQHGYKMSLQ